MDFIDNQNKGELQAVKKRHDSALNQQAVWVNVWTSALPFLQVSLCSFS